MSKINFKSDYSNFEKQINKTIQWFKRKLKNRNLVESAMRTGFT